MTTGHFEKFFQGNLYSVQFCGLNLTRSFSYPISTGGGGESPPSGFSSITQKREKIFCSNLVTSCNDKWVTIYNIKLEDRPFHVAMATAQIKEVQK